MRKSDLNFLMILTLIVGMLAACEKSGDNSDDDEDDDTGIYTYDTSTVVHVTLNGSSITVVPDVADVSGTKVTIRSAGTYKITGSLTDGQIVVNADNSGNVRLILDCVNIKCSNSAPIYIKDADRALINLAEGTVNTLTDGITFATVDGEPNAALFSDADLVIYGDGTLNVTANYNDGISSDDGLVIRSGIISVTAADDGIRGKDYVVIQDGTITINSSGDAIHSDLDVSINGGTISASTKDDGIHAETSVTINGGTLNVVKSYEAVESASITVNKGNVNLVATNDGFNATKGSGGEGNDGSELNFYGGYIVVSVSNGDGLDSNGNISMTGGTVIVHGPQSAPEVAFDFNGSFKISGGLLIAGGPNAGHMIEVPGENSSQYCIKATSQAGVFSSVLFHIQNASGNDIVTFKPVRNIYYFVYSSPQLTSGASYSIYTGGASTGVITDGLYTDGTYTGGTLKKTFTLSGKITSVTF